MNECPHCQARSQQVKVGGRQSVANATNARSGNDGTRLTPKCQQAVGMYIDGMKFRRIARQLSVHLKRLPTGLMPT